MNNFPMGVSASTYGAPWNDIEEEVSEEVVLSIEGGIYMPGPLSKHDTESCIQAEKDELYKQIEDVLNKYILDFKFKIL
jgi:hypothetical protein